jgi:putative transposase
LPGVGIVPDAQSLASRALAPRRRRSLATALAWISNTHVKRYRQHYHDKIGGHLYQGRFRSFPVQQDEHLLTVLRYVEANPLRARLAQRAGEWPWSSDALRNGPFASLFSDWPMARPTDWTQWVESRWNDQEWSEVRTSLERGCPYGEKAWVEATAKRLGLEITLRRHGGKRAAEKTGKTASY